MGRHTLLHTFGVRLASLVIGLFYASLAVIANLIRWARKGSIIFEVKERSSPPACLSDPKYGRHNFIQLNDVRLHLVEKGDRTKPLMLFVHGFPEFWFSWRHQIVEFSKTHWVIAIDQRGYGESDKPSWRSNYRLSLLAQDICQLVRALGNQKCVLVAHDWGGIVAWEVAARSPNLVEKLIIMNAPHPETIRLKLRSSLGQFLKSWYFFFFQVPFIPEICYQLNDLGIFNRIFLDENKKQFVTDEEMDAFKYTFSRGGAWTPPINYYRQNIDIFLLPDDNEFQMYPKIQAPTLLIWGENDLFLNKDFTDLARSHVSNDLRIKFIPNGNHFIQQDKPQIVNSLMKEFLN